MRLAIVGDGYTTAAEACVHANHACALRYDALVDGLAPLGEMAGDAATSADFAASYDEAAEAAVAALAEATEAFTTVGRLVHLSLASHVDAEQRSVLPGAAVFDGSVLPDEATYAAVLPCPPPSSLGGDLGSFPEPLNWILDQVESFVWPDADVDKLRTAASVWRTASGGVAALVDHADLVISSLGQERSPEIPVAIGAVHDLKGALCGLADQYTDLATACADYADEVEAQRDAILDLLHDLVRDTILISGAGAALSVLTGGGSVAAAMAATAARITSATPKLTGFVELVRAAAVASSGAIRAAGTALAPLRDVLGRFVGVFTAGSARGLTRSMKDLELTVAIRQPGRFDPESLRGMSPARIRGALDGWTSHPSSRGVGEVFTDPLHSGRQIRIMEGYPGNRPDSLTHQAYVVVSQNGRKSKIPLGGQG